VCTSTKKLKKDLKRHHYLVFKEQGIYKT
jgi:hypothetical protein